MLRVVRGSRREYFAMKTGAYGILALALEGKPPSGGDPPGRIGGPEKSLQTLEKAQNRSRNSQSPSKLPRSAAAEHGSLSRSSVPATKRIVKTAPATCPKRRNNTMNRRSLQRILAKRAPNSAPLTAQMTETAPTVCRKQQR